MTTRRLASGAATGAPEADAFVTVPLRHPGRWVAAIVVLGILALVLWSLFTNERFQWDVVAAYFFSPRILEGLGVTLWLTAVAMLLAIVLGVALALMRLSPNPVLRSGASAYIWFFRGTPLLVQMIFLYNISALYPHIEFFGESVPVNELLTKPVVAIVALALNEAAYAAEIVRAGIQAVDNGQTEAAQALGLKRSRVLGRIVLPQAMKVIVPPLANDTINMLKFTSLVSVIAMPELLYTTQLIYSRTYETVPLLLVAALWYLVVTSVLSVGQYYLERRLNRSSSRPPQESVFTAWLRGIVQPRRGIQTEGDVR